MKRMNRVIESPVWIPFWLALLALMIAAGCGPTQSRNHTLEEARAAYQRASTDPTVKKLAPVPLHEARQELQKAEAAWDDGEEDQTDHHAYLASQNVDIALAAARAGHAQRTTDELHDVRDDVVIAAREREIELLKDAKRTDRGIVVTLEDVLFEFDRAELKPGAERRLLEVVTFLRENPERNVSIEGHTDAIGSNDYNQDLSRRRARSVREFFSAHGVSGDRIYSNGYGEQYPVATNDTPSGRQQNRRVEIVILDEGASPRTPVG